MRVATPGYFDALGIPLRRGRVLRDADSEQPSGAVLVTNATVQKSNARARSDRCSRSARVGGVEGARAWSEVVGVVGNVRGSSLEEEPMGAVSTQW